MEKGYKDFTSIVMDLIGVDKVCENRLNDLMFAEVKLRILNNRGKCVEETMQLIGELSDYIHYLCIHIDQLEKDKRYLLKEKLKEKYKNSRIV